MPAFTKLVMVETKLLRRDLVAVFFGLLFPSLLLLVLGGAFPGFLEPNPDLDGRRLVDVYAPIVLVLAVTLTAVSMLPAALAGAREKGFLRRMSTTPVGPTRLLVAQLTVHVATALLGSTLAVGVAAIAFDIDLPERPLGFAAAFVLLVLALFSIGLLIGAVVPGTSAAQAAGTLVWMPLMVLAGLWFPREAMPETMRTISDLTPGGAGVQAIQNTWFGAAPGASNLAVMAVSAAVIGLVAARMFRWE